MNPLIAYRAGGSVLFGRWRGDSPPELQALRNPASAEFARHRPTLFAQYAIDYVVVATRARDLPGIWDLVADYPAVFQNKEFTILECGRPETGTSGEGGGPPAAQGGFSPCVH